MIEMEFKCPHCNNHQYCDSDDLKFEDGDEKMIKCNNCDQYYMVRGYSTVNYLVEEVC